MNLADSTFKKPTGRGRQREGRVGLKPFAGAERSATFDARAKSGTEIEDAPQLLGGMDRKESSSSRSTVNGEATSAVLRSDYVAAIGSRAVSRDNEKPTRRVPRQTAAWEDATRTTRTIKAVRNIIDWHLRSLWPDAVKGGVCESVPAPGLASCAAHQTRSL